MQVLQPELQASLPVRSASVSAWLLAALVPIASAVPPEDEPAGSVAVGLVLSPPDDSARAEVRDSVVLEQAQPAAHSLPEDFPVDSPAGSQALQVDQVAQRLLAPDVPHSVLPFSQVVLPSLPVAPQPLDAASALHSVLAVVRDAQPEPAAVSQTAQEVEAVSFWRRPAGSLPLPEARPRDLR